MMPYLNQMLNGEGGSSEEGVAAIHVMSYLPISKWKFEDVSSSK